MTGGTDMKVTQELQSSRDEIEVLRADLASARAGIDRADSVLAGTDNVLLAAEKADAVARRFAPAIGIGLAATAAVVVTMVIVRRRRSRRLA